MSPRARQVVGREANVKAEARRERKELLRRLVTEPALPQRHRITVLRRAGLVAPPRSRRRDPRGGRSPRSGRDGSGPRSVRREPVVVEPHRAAATHREAATGYLAPQTHLPGDEPLALVDERVECLLQRREPQPVVDQVGITRLEARLFSWARSRSRVRSSKSEWAMSSARAPGHS